MSVTTPHSSLLSRDCRKRKHHQGSIWEPQVTSPFPRIFWFYKPGAGSLRTIVPVDSEAAPDWRSTHWDPLSAKPAKVHPAEVEYFDFHIKPKQKSRTSLLSSSYLKEFKIKYDYLRLSSSFVLVVKENEQLRKDWLFLEYSHEEAAFYMWTLLTTLLLEKVCLPRARNSEIVFTFMSFRETSY